MADLPTGTVTFLFTDVEGSTRLWEQQPQAMRQALARHDAIIEGEVEGHGGLVVRPRGEGDSRFAVFARATDAIAAAAAIQWALHAERWVTSTPLRVRLALHTGEADLREGDYYGSAVNRCARLRAVAHGGQTLLSQATADLVREALPAGASLRDLGERRLADLNRAEPVYQLLLADLPADFPPLQSLGAWPNNLPLQLTSFVGRQQEVAAVKEALAAARLLTLTGIGGCGKTRLALQVAADVLECYPDGVWLVELAPLADPALVPATVATVVGAREQPGQPLQATVLQALGSKRLLLLLDNCEHLLDICARLVDALLRTCPHVRILATSRESLGISGETSRPVPALTLPPSDAATIEQVARSEAGRLFLERAFAVRPDLRLSGQQAAAVAQVCARLDGIPLAIELAAARLRVLSVAQLATRLDQRFRLLTSGSRTALPRQQTLQAAIDWSYELLGTAERTLFNRLAVFSGGFSLEVAEIACAGRGIEQTDILETLARLVDKSLVVVEEREHETRYHLIETLRQYGRERLGASGEAEGAYRALCDWALALVERAAPELSGPQQALWIDRLEEEQDNLRAVLEWCRQHDTSAGLRLAASQWHFWQMRGYFSEGRQWLEVLLSAAPAPTGTRAVALRGAGILALGQGDRPGARRLLEASLALCRELEDRAGIGWALNHLGELAAGDGDFPLCRALQEQSVAIFTELGDPRGVAWALLGLAGLAVSEGQYARSKELYEQSLMHFRRLGNRRGIIQTLHESGLLSQVHAEYAAAEALVQEAYDLAGESHNAFEAGWLLCTLGNLARIKGDFSRARSLLERSAAHFRVIGNTLGTGSALHLLAHVAAAEGDYRAARPLYEERLRVSRDAGVTRAVAVTLGDLANLARMEGEDSRARALWQESLSILRHYTGNAWHVAWALGNVGALEARRGRFASGARLLSAATVTHSLFRTSLDPDERAECDAALMASRASLSEDAFSKAWADGQAMTPQRAIAFALSVCADTADGSSWREIANA